MQPLSPTVRLILGAIAAGLGTLLAPDVFGILPVWAQVVIGFVSTVVAFLLLPVNWQVNQARDRAFKSRSVSAKAAVHRGDGPPPPRRKSRGLRAMIALALAMIVTLLAPAVTAASPESTYSAYARQYCGNGFGVCVFMDPTYCTQTGRYSFTCANNWVETSLRGFRNQASSGVVFQGWVSSFRYWTTSS